PSDRTRNEPRLKRTWCSSVRCASYGCHCSCGIVGKKLQRSNSSKPSDSERISTFPTRIVLLAMLCPPQANHPSASQGTILAQRTSIRGVQALEEGPVDPKSLRLGIEGAVPRDCVGGGGTV